jgi:hypothetical protein
VGPFLTWLIAGGIGPAAAGLPVNWAAEKLTDAATRWFKRMRHTDDLSRLVKAAMGTSVGLTGDEFDDVRELLEQRATWDRLGSGTVDQIAAEIAACLPAREGRDSVQAAMTIARGLLEFAVSGLEPDVFQDVLMARLKRMDTAREDRDRALDEALFSLHAGLMSGFADVLAKLDLVLARLAPEPAQRTAILVYLSTLIDELGTDAWARHWYRLGSALSEARIERKLYLTSGSDRDLDADLLAEQCERLVILGDPGSGKTWLARRAARRCAERARDDLAGGSTSLDEVEIPLYTTCSDLFKVASDFRDASVSSALNSLPDMGGRIKTALREFFMDRHAPTLLVIDSLDEAYGSDKFLGRARSLPWRIMLTTRPSSWRDQLDLDPGRRGHRVASIQPLRYPGDVGPFIEQWFSGEPDQGEDLAAQIGSRPDLQRAATVPLILTFLCILGGGEQLPRFRSDLYGDLLSNLLDGYWHDIGQPGDQPDIDKDACQRTLEDWAWSAAGAADPVSGVGAWTDEIQTDPVRLGPLEMGALDHIAPPLGRAEGRTRQVPRRFIHRSVREYLVAEYVSRLSVEQAGEALLPHLWYDADWENVAPAALAMHAERDQLLLDLIGRASGTGQVPEDISVIDAGEQLARFLARVACESREADWLSETAALIGRSRIDLVRAGRMDDVGWAVDWETSNRKAREELLTLIAGQAKGGAAADLAAKMIRLKPTAEDARQACRTLAGLLAPLAGWPAADLVDAMVGLATAADAEQQARDIMLGLITPQAHPLLAAELARGITGLKPTSDEEQRVRRVLLLLMTGQDGSRLTELAEALTRLSPEPDDKQRARAVIAGQLTTTQRNGRMAAGLASALARLDPTPAQRQQGHKALQDWLARDTAVASDPVAQDWSSPRHMERFLAHGSIAEELDALVSLAAAEGGQAPARDVILGLLSRQLDSSMSERLAADLVLLDPADADKRRACGTLLQSLIDATEGSAAAQFCDGLMLLGPTTDDKRRARKAMLSLLANPDASGATWLAGRLAQLYPGEDEAEFARALLLKRSQNDGYTAEDLLGWLVRLDPTPPDKLKACDILIGFLEHGADRAQAARLAMAMVPFDPPPDYQRRARGTLLDLLAGAAGSLAGELASAIAALAPTPDDKLQARRLLHGLLAGGDNTANIFGAMAHLDSPVTEISEWHQWAAPPTDELLAAARQNSPLQDWLEALSGLPASLAVEAAPSLAWRPPRL